VKDECPIYNASEKVFPKITQENIQLVQIILAKYIPYTVVAQKDEDENQSLCSLQ
jgi:hypothetical protein